MLFGFAFLYGFLYASAVLAGRLQYGKQNRTAFSSAAARGITGTNWAGGMLTPGSGSVNFVQGTFTVPHVSGASGSGVSIWVGIDGISCDPVLQAGILFEVGNNGVVACSAWYEWFPDPAQLLDMTLSVGDVIEVSVTAHSATSGAIMIKNHNTGQIKSEELSSNYELCMEDAEWIVEDPGKNGQQMPFAYFSTVKFINALAMDDDETYEAGEGTFIDFAQDNNYLAYASVWNTDVVVIHAP